MGNKIQPVKSDSVIYSSSARLKVERTRLGLSQVALGKALGVTKWTVINYERTGGRGTPIPADLLSACSKLGMDVQYIITGVSSSNLNRVAEEAGSYRTELKRPTVLSKEEQQLLEKYRRLKPSQRAQARSIVEALVSAEGKTAKKPASRPRHGKR
ncbi:MAG: helix-turn-helix domain-containing protein [Sulfuricaulis sp.]|uniref:helix-turn-helix transcriptional regulator n=1 Tax=Sulfuricaulis sp. TaxID=2003553 RepID=UPI0025D39F42|nr:helix-turn-helix domain-containing protein [Sulfuricaulis sp.]MCR4346330.1 helix-turn-helix domain-containing protein [Sulfuricaulis sp.]